MGCRGISRSATASAACRSAATTSSSSSGGSSATTSAGVIPFAIIPTTVATGILRPRIHGTKRNLQTRRCDPRSQDVPPHPTAAGAKRKQQVCATHIGVIRCRVACVEFGQLWRLGMRHGVGSGSVVFVRGPTRFSRSRRAMTMRRPKVSRGVMVPPGRLGARRRKAPGAGQTRHGFPWCSAARQAEVVSTIEHGADVARGPLVGVMDEVGIDVERRRCVCIAEATADRSNVRAVVPPADHISRAGE